MRGLGHRGLELLMLEQVPDDHLGSPRSLLLVCFSGYLQKQNEAESLAGVGRLLTFCRNEQVLVALLRAGA